MDADTQTASPARLPAWQALLAHRKAQEDTTIARLFAQDPGRFECFSVEGAGLHLDYSKNRLTAETLHLLTSLAQEAGLAQRTEAMFSGAQINPTENRPALHTALRAPRGSAVQVAGANVVDTVHATLDRMEALTQALHSRQWAGYRGEPIRDVVCLGIGGSYLGPKVVSEALKPYWHDAIRCHFVANIDGAHLADTLAKLRAETTLFLVASKSFTTQETLANARSARTWFLQQGGREADLGKHLIAVTANTQRALEFGVAAEHIFPMWDWVGGRYSLWSAIGLPIALRVGMKNFRALLQGAHAMDVHFRETPFEQNLPVLLGLLGIWYRNFGQAASHAVVPYDHSLRGLPAYLQQLDMESNGKRVRGDATAVEYGTGMVLWGGEGSNGQHAFHQLLHQGTDLIPVDFIVPLRPHHTLHDHHAQLFASCLSQSKALATGRSLAEAHAALVESGLSDDEARRLAPHRVHPGNRPSNTITMEQLTPSTLGALIALYEHKVFVQGMIWGINPFDQWGVELGKQLAGEVLDQLTAPDDVSGPDSSTCGLIARYRRAHPPG